VETQRVALVMAGGTVAMHFGSVYSTFECVITPKRQNSLSPWLCCCTTNHLCAWERRDWCWPVFCD